MSMHADNAGWSVVSEYPSGISDPRMQLIETEQLARGIEVIAERDATCLIDGADLGTPFSPENCHDVIGREPLVVE